MPIPNAASAHIPPEKLADYLLNEQHPVGGGKAKWFQGLGYEATNPFALAQDLRELVRTSEDYLETTTPFGTKFVVSGTITAPNGKVVIVLSVWIIEPSEPNPRLVTAYPGERS